MPPMMTITKASMMTVAAMPFEAVTSGAASTPPSAASPQPMPNTHERMSLTSTPSACTMSAFCEVARISSPSRVRSSNCQIAIATTMPVAARNRR